MGKHKAKTRAFIKQLRNPGQETSREKRTYPKQMFCTTRGKKPINSLCFIINRLIYIFTFSRRFYPKRLTVHSGYTFFFFYQYVTFCTANAKLYHWATGTLYMIYMSSHSVVLLTQTLNSPKVISRVSFDNQLHSCVHKIQTISSQTRRQRI